MSYPVKIHAYDVSHGKARHLSVTFFGKYLDGLYHTGIVVHGSEYFYGGKGIAYVIPGSTSLGHPTEIIDMGFTNIDKEKFHEYLEELSETKFTPEKYRVAEYNCNNFTCDVVLYLTGRKAPDKIANVTADIRESAFGQILLPMAKNMQGGPQHNGTFIRRRQVKTVENNENDVIRNTTDKVKVVE